MSWVLEVAIAVVVAIALAPLALGYAVRRPSTPYEAHRRGMRALRETFSRRPHIEGPDEAAYAARGVFGVVATAAGIGIGVVTRSGALGALAGLAIAFVAAALTYSRLNR